MSIIESLLPTKRTLSRVRRLFDRVRPYRHRSASTTDNATTSTTAHPPSSSDTECIDDDDDETEEEDNDNVIDNLLLATNNTTHEHQRLTAGTVLVLDSHGEFIWRRGHRSLSATELNRICEADDSLTDDDIGGGDAQQCENPQQQPVRKSTATTSTVRRRRFTTNNSEAHRPMMHLRRCCRLWAQLRRPYRRRDGDATPTSTATQGGATTSRHNSTAPHCVGGGGGNTIRAQVALQRLLGCQQRMSELRGTINAHAQYRRRMIGRYRRTGGLRYKVTQMLATRYADEACAEMEALQQHYWQRLRRTALADLQLPWSSMMLAHHGRLMRRIVRDLRELDEADGDY